MTKEYRVRVSASLYQTLLSEKRRLKKKFPKRKITLFKASQSLAKRLQ